MSTIISSYLKDRVSAKQLTTLMSIDGTVKAFANFNGISMAVASSMNVTTFTDGGTGNWIEAYTTHFDTASMAAGSAHYAGVFWAYVSLIGAHYNMNITAYNVTTTSGAYGDVSLVETLTTGRMIV